MMLKSNKSSSLLIEFVGHLKLSGVSPNTLKNYRSDFFLFESWTISKLKSQGIPAESLGEAIPFLSLEIAKGFRSFLSSRHSSQSSVNRHLSTLRALARFLVETQISEFDFMQDVANVGNEDKTEVNTHPTLIDFQKHLESQKVSRNTIRNYVSDVKHFLSWLEANH